MKLYEFGLSGNCHKVRLLLSLLELSYEKHIVNGSAAEHKSADYLQLNPLGQVPVLVDDSIAIRDSQAILVYLALKKPHSGFYPSDPVLQAKIQSWLSVASNEITRGPAMLRMHHKFGKTIDIEAAHQVSSQILQFLEQQLAKTPWLVGTAMTIADISIYPYVALAHEGFIDLKLYPAIQRWLTDIETLPGYVTMPGIKFQNQQVNL